MAGGFAQLRHIDANSLAKTSCPTLSGHISQGGRLAREQARWQTMGRAPGARTARVAFQVPVNSATASPNASSSRSTGPRGADGSQCTARENPAAA